MPQEVTFQNKAVWQKRDCINPECNRESVMEAVLGDARIRCCEMPKCREFAIKLALAAGKG